MFQAGVLILFQLLSWAAPPVPLFCPKPLLLIFTASLSRFTSISRVFERQLTMVFICSHQRSICTAVAPSLRCVASALCLVPATRPTSARKRRLAFLFYFLIHLIHSTPLPLCSLFTRPIISIIADNPFCCFLVFRQYVFFLRNLFLLLFCLSSIVTCHNFVSCSQTQQSIKV